VCSNKRKDRIIPADAPTASCRRLTRAVLSLIFAHSLWLPVSVGADRAKVRTYEGLYTNQKYGYSVLLPKGVVALGTAPPNPDHGFTIGSAPAGDSITLYKAHDCYIWVDGNYDPFDEVQTLDDAVRYEIHITEKTVGARVRVESRLQTTLGGLMAVHVIYAFKAEGQPMVGEEVIALRNNERNEPVFLYTVGMQTTPQSRTANARIWTQIVSAFNTLPFAP